MKVVSRFFDNNEWSVYATLQTIIPLAILYLGSHNNILKYLVVSSLIGMMEGTIKERAIYSFFLSLMIWSGNTFVLNTSLTVISAILTGLIPYNNIVHKYVLSNKILTNTVYFTIFIWFVIIIHLIKKMIL